jgi:hypothetical protein
MGNGRVVRGAVAGVFGGVLVAGCSAGPHGGAAATSPAPTAVAATATAPATPAPTAAQLLRQITAGEPRPVLTHTAVGAGWNRPALALAPGKYTVVFACDGAGRIGGTFSAGNHWSSRCGGDPVTVDSETDTAGRAPVRLSVAVDPAVTWALAVFR